MIKDVSGNQNYLPETQYEKYTPYADKSGSSETGVTEADPALNFNNYNQVNKLSESQLAPSELYFPVDEKQPDFNFIDIDFEPECTPGKLNFPADPEIPGKISGSTPGKEGMGDTAGYTDVSKIPPESDISKTPSGSGDTKLPPGTVQPNPSGASDPRIAALGVINSSSLSESDKATARRLAASLADPANPKALAAFTDIVRERPQILTSRNSMDLSLLDTLDLMARTPRHSSIRTQGLLPQMIAGDTIMNIADPGRIRQHGGTCGAATMEYEMARNNPAEYAYIVDGLTSEGGRVRLGPEMASNSAYLTLNTGSVPRYRSPLSNTPDMSTIADRDVSRMFQSSVMDQASIMARAVGSSYNIENDDSSFEAVIGGDSAIAPGGFASVYSSMSGRRYTDSRDIAATIQAAGIRDGDANIPVLMNFDQGTPGSIPNHWVSLVRYIQPSGDQPAMVVLRNPQPIASGSRPDVGRSLNSSEGTITMPYIEFERRFYASMLPAGR